MDGVLLKTAVDKFARSTHALPDRDLEREWEWQEYDEGVRFAFFRTYEELRELAVDLGAERAAGEDPRTKAQRALAQYHAAYRDLQAILFEVSDDRSGDLPIEGEWPLSRVLYHIIRTERSFFGITSYAVDRFRSNDSQDVEMPEEAWNAFWAGDPFRQMGENEPLSTLLAYYDTLHRRILNDFANLTDDELEAPSRFWESNPMPVQFRLHRFDSHLRQHTIQIEKTLAALDLNPNEARRLLRLIYAALAEVEGLQIGAKAPGMEQIQTVGEQIAQRAEEIDSVLAG